MQGLGNRISLRKQVYIQILLLMTTRKEGDTYKWANGRWLLGSKVSHKT